MRSQADGLPVPETLRRLMNAVLGHQGGKLRDDATVMFCEWRGTHRNLRLSSGSTRRSRTWLSLPDEPIRLVMFDPAGGGSRRGHTQDVSWEAAMASVFDVLGRDHVEVKRMLAELEKGPTAATGADEDALALRKKMTQQLVIEESKHEAVEEMYFWPTVREALPDGDKLADTATGQEQEAKHGWIGSTSWTPATRSRAIGRVIHPGGPGAHRLRGRPGVAATA